jgi:hypothetical protein
MNVTLERLDGGRWRARGSSRTAEGESPSRAIYALLTACGAPDFRLMNCPESFGSPKDLDCDGDTLESAERRWRKDVREGVAHLRFMEKHG